MSSLDEKGVSSPDIHQADSQHSSDADLQHPTGWLYTARKIGPITIPYYASPKAQLLIVAFVCFLCPGELPHALHSRHVCHC